ncbi:MAG: hypothetical protein SAJ37_17610, partial [Oscillatoria sp. PMC 1068.18]|nr:hypothetical protein [Oscillatoria sp. PMC 1076.18]MEC4990551.1 hypothetical protein [Oscillatoria sp. PMC 1068.18]
LLISSEMDLSEQDRKNLCQFIARIKQIGIQPYEVAFWLLEKDVQTIENIFQKEAANKNPEAAKLFAWVKEELMTKFSHDYKIQQETLDYLLLYR